MSIILEPGDIPKSIDRYVDMLERQGLSSENIDRRIDSYLKNHVVLKYSKEWQDARLDEMIKTILEVDGGYFQIQELLNQPHVEFEHHRERNRQSYEKGNVSDAMAKRELTEHGYKSYTKFKQLRKSKMVDCDVNVGVNIPKHL